ncbi:MAG TPA: capsular polysaccharide synthesis protein [Tepidisphaeraceae bacterium]|jgi:hypothetical protein|nr:capsular polysaccharide synthesis protein [Tepidisphaeraceae bacterium]
MTKVIWTYWQQGWDQAPPLVKKCHESWIRLNPDYEIHALDDKSLFNYISFPETIDFTRSDLTIQKIAVLARLELLARFGGVWVDATVYCTRPLREWLPDCFQSEFFAFRRPTVDCLSSNWLIAAETGSLILQRVQKDFTDFFANNQFTNQNTPFGEMLVQRYSQRWCKDPQATLKWHSRFAREVLRIYPYLIYHYTFNRLILTDPSCAEQWNQARPLLSDRPHYLQGYARAGDGKGAIEYIRSRATPVHKLNWRVDSASPYWAAVLDELEACV